MVRIAKNFECLVAGRYDASIIDFSFVRTCLTFYVEEDGEGLNKVLWAMHLVISGWKMDSRQFLLKECLGIICIGWLPEKDVMPVNILFIVTGNG